MVAAFRKRTELADQIGALAKTKEMLPLSIGVFGTWGTGKSTVLRLVLQPPSAAVSAMRVPATTPVLSTETVPDSHAGRPWARGAQRWAISRKVARLSACALSANEGVVP